MARIETDPNYTAPTFSRATAATDSFKKEDVQNLAAAMSAHDHSTGKGLVIAAGGIGTGVITSAMLADGTVATGDLADGAVTSIKIADGTIATGDIADGAITSAKIADGTVATVDLAANAASGVPVLYGPVTPSFSTTAVATQVATPMTVSLTSITTGVVRVSGYAAWTHSVANVNVLWTLYVDGAPVTSVAAQQDPVAGGWMSFGFEVLLSPGIGAHTYTIYAYQYAAGTLTMGAGNAHMNAMEHKR